MIGRIFVSLVLGFSTLTSLSAQDSIRRLDGSHMKQSDAASFAAKTLAANHVTGAQIAVLNGGRLVWSYAYGLRGKSPDLAMDRDTTAWAASITKGVFATYVMQLVERGEFDLDRPVAQQLPKPLTSYPAYQKTAAELVDDPRWPLVTPRMLLSHTAGFRNFVAQEEDGKLHLHSTPGTEFRYSGDGINMVQFVIEQQKGRPLDQLVNESIFTPFGMQRTALLYEPRLGENIADRFDLNEAFLSKTRRSAARGAGSMTTSAEDLARFATALFDGRIMRAATQAKMLAPQIDIRSVHQFPQPTDHPPSLEAANAGLAYGIGWGLLTHTRFGPAFFKEGHGDGAENYMICFTRKRDCMIVLTNSDNGEFAFRPLLETILGDTVTPWEWESYTPAAIAVTRANP